jgi:phage/plasmid-like protein (TIGR03299 family)
MRTAINPSWSRDAVKLSTAAEIAKAKGLDFSVSKQQLFDADMTPVTSVFGLKRNDRKACFPGVSVGSRYNFMQIAERFSVLDSIVDSGKGAHYHNAGTFKDGLISWMSISLPGLCRIGGTDEVRSYLICWDFLGGSGTMGFGLTDVAISCMNTLMWAKKTALHKVTIRHTTNIAARAQEANDVLKLVNLETERLHKLCDRLAEVKLKPADLEKYGKSLGYKPDSDLASERDEWRQYLMAFESAPGQNDPARKRTLWGAVNAVTYLEDHGTAYKARDGRSGEERKAHSTLLGAGAERKELAFDAALALL